VLVLVVVLVLDSIVAGMKPHDLREEGERDVSLGTGEMLRFA
jgi:hypothetical protein